MQTVLTWRNVLMALRIVLQCIQLPVLRTLFKHDLNLLSQCQDIFGEGR